MSYHFYYVFVSFSDPSLPAIALNVSEGRDNLWAKTKQAFAYVYENYKWEPPYINSIKQTLALLVPALLYEEFYNRNELYCLSLSVISALV
jgi:hypothetical protein